VTVTVLPGTGAPTEVGDDEVDRLWSAIQPEFLTTLEWSPEHQVITFPQGHSLLGWRQCRIANCHNNGRSGLGLCPACTRRWTALDDASFDEFVRMGKPVQRCIGVARCAVNGCQRPAKSTRLLLCTTHDYQRKFVLQLPLNQFVAHPDVVPLSAYGSCMVAACTRDRIGRGPYCQQHANRFKLAKKHDPHLDVENWRRTMSAISENSQVSLRGLPARVVAEVLYGLQERTRAEVKSSYLQLRPVCDAIRKSGATSIVDLALDGFPRHTRIMAGSITKAVQRFGRTPESERWRDVWDLFVFGHAATLTFTGISQPWLREAAKNWAYNDLPKRRGKHAGAIVRNKINALTRLSDSLRLQRADHGDEITALARGDITAFCNRMAYLQDQEKISAHTRLTCCRDIRFVLTTMRTMGLTKPGKPLHGLPDDFALTQDDIPDEPEDTIRGKDLPVEVMQHLCGHLPQLAEINTRDLRVATELLIDTGRRPDEIARLDLDCLDRDHDGKPVLIYDNHKAHRHARRLPIPEATAALITHQQDIVRTQFPDTPSNELKLFPAPIRNPAGRRAINDDWITSRHRKWVDGLPDVTVPTPIEVNGKIVTKMLPFDKAKIFPYAYRHTYAQRHADAGVDVTVLKELMDHRQLSTTQGYYRVGEERRREAVERVITMQFDRHGNRVWRQAKALLDSEHLRRAVGEVAVPYGGCTEPSNVAAAGQDCMLRFRCIGCGHFSTDISYLPDLERYLADLLRHRERLAATLDADEWARNEALPSDQEITRIRRLIDRMKGDLDELSDEDRAQIEDAVAVVRRGRSKIVGLGMPRIRQPLPDLRPERTA
jgi:integrase